MTSPLIGKKVKHKYTDSGDGTVLHIDTHLDKFRLLIQRPNGELVTVWAGDVTVVKP